MKSVLRQWKKREVETKPVCRTIDANTAGTEQRPPKLKRMRSYLPAVLYHRPSDVSRTQSTPNAVPHLSRVLRPNLKQCQSEIDLTQIKEAHKQALSQLPPPPSRSLSHSNTLFVPPKLRSSSLTRSGSEAPQRPPRPPPLYESPPSIPSKLLAVPSPTAIMKTMLSNKSVPELDGIWEGFLQDVDENLESPERRGFSLSTQSSTYPSLHERSPSTSSSSISDSDSSELESLPPRDFLFPYISSTPHLPSLRIDEKVDRIANPSPVEPVSLSLFPKPPPLSLNRRRDLFPLTLQPITPSPTFPPSPSSSSDSSTLTTPTTPRGFAVPRPMRSSLSPTSAKHPVSPSTICRTESQNGPYVKFPIDTVRPLRAARSVSNLRTRPDTLMVHRITASESVSPGQHLRGPIAPLRIFKNTSQSYASP